MEHFCNPREDRTLLPAGFITNCNDIGKYLPRLPNIKHAPCLSFRDVNTNFAHYLDSKRIKFAWSQTSALSLKLAATYLVQKRFCHLAPRAVVNAHKKNLFLSHRFFLHSKENLHRSKIQAEIW